MKRLLLFASLVLGTGMLAPAAQAADTATLTVTFTGMKAGAGAILFAVMNSEDAYNDKAKPVAQERLPVAGSSVSLTLTGLAPGRYAIKAFHDINNDGKMGANPFGIPTEPFAFSNNAKGGMGPAKWDAAAFAVEPGANVHAIDID